MTTTPPNKIDSFVESIQARHVAVVLVLTIMMGLVTGLIGDMVITAIKQATGGYGARFYVVQTCITLGLLIAVVAFATFAVIKPFRKEADNLTAKL